MPISTWSIHRRNWPGDVHVGNEQLCIILHEISTYWFQRHPPARGESAQNKILHLANWSQLIRTSVKSDQGFWCRVTVMRVNADSLLIRAATTSTSGTLNDLTTDLIMANNNNNSVLSIAMLIVSSSRWGSFFDVVGSGLRVKLTDLEIKNSKPPPNNKYRCTKWRLLQIKMNLDSF